MATRKFGGKDDAQFWADKPIQPRHEFQHPSFKLSTDYNLLWRLIHEWQRIPAWLVNNVDFGSPMWDVVEVRISKITGHYFIGSRGISYTGGVDGFDDFKNTCIQYSLHFVMPNNQTIVKINENHVYSSSKRRAIKKSIGRH